MAKMKLNSIGFGDTRKMMRGEKIVQIGIGIAVVGLAVITIGFFSQRNAHTWFAATDEPQLNEMITLYKFYDGSFKDEVANQGLRLV